MANICTNKLYLQTKNRRLRDTLTKSIRKSFFCNDILYNDDDVFRCEIEFDSRWTFPHSKMETLTQKLPKKNDLYIRVLSYEFDCEYVGFNIYTDGEWQNRFAG